MKSDLPVSEHFDRVAKNYDYGKKKYSYYYENLKRLLGELIPNNKSVLEIGCGTGDLLNHLRPKYGYGFDISNEMIRIAKNKQFLASQGPGRNSKNLYFSTKFPSSNHQSPFTNHHSPDFIFMSDVIEHLEDPKGTFRNISNLMSKETAFICTMANPVWEPVLMLAEKLGLKMPEGQHHRPKIKEYRLWIEETGMKITKHDYTLLVPVKIPLITNFANEYLEKYFKRFSFIEYFVAKVA